MPSSFPSVFLSSSDSPGVIFVFSFLLFLTCTLLILVLFLFPTNGIRIGIVVFVFPLLALLLPLSLSLYRPALLPGGAVFLTCHFFLLLLHIFFTCELLLLPAFLSFSSHALVSEVVAWLDPCSSVQTLTQVRLNVTPSHCSSLSLEAIGIQLHAQHQAVTAASMESGPGC